MDVVIAGAGVASAAFDSPGDTLNPPRARAGGFNPGAILGRGVRYKDRCTQLAMVAAGRALLDGLVLEPDSADRGLTVPQDSVGVVASSNLGNLDTVCHTAEVLASRSVSAISPMALPNASGNIVASSIAVRFGLRGPNLMLSNGSSSGLDAVSTGARLITAGRAHRVLVVGVEPVNDVVAHFVGAPAETLFDGAGAVLLESAADAVERGVVPRARVAEYARRGDLAASVERVIGGGPTPRLWFTEDELRVPESLRDVPRRGLQASLGSASGALGVLQVIAGTHWLGAGGDGPVLASAGADDDGVAALLLTTSGAPG